ncbi:MAG TPA: arsenosugar biosynthesis radical SAM protein ArsS [Candidatus Dorea gallistercoris]|uniref:Arsenosugar biosynthesis radical SAM protein ArsS n=1 Tax=Candidatus Dorea gallistercoris TaxID=2838542 RepID=A0A9D1RD99_9FIRM|nr:arsenosugar biosynthesis radical SAM protein ArsS [Candidatus Dorea gallistercoris]
MNQALEDVKRQENIPDFESRIKDEKILYTQDHLDVMQINVGRLCNLACRHCHVEAGPERTEVMSRKVMEACLQVCLEQKIPTIDITGGAPEMNQDFEWLVEEACKVCGHVIVRTNLVILQEEKYRDLPKFYADHKVEIVCSLPYYRAKEMDRIRGEGTFAQAIQVIQELNRFGYGRDTDLILNMVYNPAGAFFPPPQGAMEQEYKARLWKDYGIVFNNLFTITNNPMGRFEAFLKRSGNLESYMKKLSDAFNEKTLQGLMCRFQISVGWDGRLYDCDFNQAADLPVSGEETIFDLTGKSFRTRRICFGNHCYGCTAGQGSSCGGATE